MSREKKDKMLKALAELMEKAKDIEVDPVFAEMGRKLGEDVWEMVKHALPSPIYRKEAPVEMTDLEWLEHRGRSFGRIRTKGATEDDGMWVAHLALNGHYTVEIKGCSLAEIIQKGRDFENTRLKVGVE